MKQCRGITTIFEIVIMEKWDRRKAEGMEKGVGLQLQHQYLTSFSVREKSGVKKTK